MKSEIGRVGEDNTLGLWAVVPGKKGMRLTLTQWSSTAQHSNQPLAEEAAAILFLISLLGPEQDFRSTASLPMTSP